MSGVIESAENATTCASCGTPIDERASREFGCTVCLFRGALAVLAPRAESERFGPFEILRREDGTRWEIGRGAMAVTYRAIDTALQRPAALKLIGNDPALQCKEARERFMREARLAASLRHPNAATVYHFGIQEESSQCYYAMELVEGETLEALVRRDGPLPLKEALELAAQIACALIAAAGHGLVHRDLKPSNLMVTRTGGELQVKVIDFGLAKTIAGSGNEMDLTHNGFVGTPAFASPEQFRGAPADARSDIYSLGVTLWYALTGETPYNGQTLEEIRHCQSSAALPVEKLIARKIPPPVIQLLTRVLALDPAQRPSSAREFAGALDSCRAQLGHIPPPASSARVGGLKVAAIVIGAAVVTALLLVRFDFRLARPRSLSGITVPEKSLAILPFENRSSEKENAFFADGVQDEILTTLAKVADLKVISRTSVMQFRDAPRQNLRDIARQLGVVHVLEGSVQRFANRVRVTAQLIDARTDSHIWADQFDGDLADVFAIQSEIAQKIANQLQAALSPKERAALRAKPTLDTTAYDLYLRARQILSAEGYEQQESIRRQVTLLDEAVARDPAFVPALCMLAQLHVAAFWLNFDHTPARLELASKSLDAAARVRPDAGEVHRARALFLYYGGGRDHAAALAELSEALRSLPNDAEVMQFIGGIQIRRGRVEDGIASLERALILDPRNAQLAGETELSAAYVAVRRYDDARRVIDNILAWNPQDGRNRLWRARIDIHEKADLGSLRQAIAELSATTDQHLIWSARRSLSLLQRDYRAAEALLSEDEPADFIENGFVIPSEYRDGMVARGLGDMARAEAAFRRARDRAAANLARRTDDAKALVVLAQMDARLGHNEDAVREGKRAAELLPAAIDAFDGVQVLTRLAGVYAVVAETDRALEVLQQVVALPSGPSYGTLQLEEDFDSLRNDPRFQKIVASLAPKR